MLVYSFINFINSFPLKISQKDFSSICSTLLAYTEFYYSFNMYTVGVIGAQGALARASEF